MPHLRYVNSFLGDIGAYCNPHIGFLIRALLKSRSGFEHSSNLIHYFARHIVQLGLFATIWNLTAMATWFLMPNYTIYAFFDATSGSVYTHVSGPFPRPVCICRNGIFRWYLIRSHPVHDCGSAWPHQATLRWGCPEWCSTWLALIPDLC